MATKLILVDGQALDNKYGGAAGEVWEAVDKLIAADAQRGIQTELVRLDDPGGPAGGSAIETGAEWVEVKRAVDAVAHAGEAPDYMMLLGGPDLLPHCQLDNPTPDDGDPIVPSDLPYACDAGPSSSAADFVAPTRVISRLPDVPGATEPSILLRALNFAAGWEGRNRNLYDSYLGISAEVWQGSTQLSLSQLYGSATDLQLSPPEGPGWNSGLLDRLSHFANLHGSPASTQYFGQSGGNYPVAHDAALVEGQLEEGAVAAVEACYGAELFEPNGQLPMPFAYLGSGAYGFFGSTTIAYGPAEGNEYADVICRLFQAAILTRASIGRAGLQARQEYVSQSAPLDPVDLKTLAQFLVLGDPSIHPVADFEQLDVEIVAGPAIKARRAELRETGEALRDTPSWGRPLERGPEEDTVSSLLNMTGLKSGVKTAATSFALVGSGVPAKMLATAGGASYAPEPATMHVLTQELEHENAPMPQRVVILALEEEGQVVSINTATSR